MLPVIILSIAIIGIYAISKLIKKDKWELPQASFPPKWRVILTKEINFYNSLSQEEKALFEFKVHEFILNYRITGIQTSVDITDKLLVASSGVIPIFKFPAWRYTNLFEILLYPDVFNEEFETTGKGRRILGMVGTGYLEGKMILSKPALHHGFDNATDKRNTAIHEFVHLIDKMDGQIDGIPELLMEQPYVLPWLDLMNHKMDEIYAEESDINPYGGKNKIEFFAVACEYFFERPKLLEKKHPDLYEHLEKVFNHDMAERNLNRKGSAIGRNSPCPCDSGKKFKKCCGSVHYK